MVVYTGERLRNKRITKVVVQDGVREIDDEAFTECPNIRSVTIPNSVTSIGHQALAGCHSLKSIAFPKSLTEIGESAFEGCTSLEQVEFPKGITYVPESAFEGCTSLHTITLPPTIEEFGTNAFDRCYNLQNFITPNGLPELMDGFDPFDVGFGSFNLIKQLMANASNLTRMTLWRRYENIKNYDLPEIMELVSACPTLREVDLSWNELSVGVFEQLASQDIPGHLRLLEIQRQCEDEELVDRTIWDDEEREEWEERQREWDEWKNSSPEHLLRVLERNPKLVIKTDKFWDDSEDDKVRHHMDMNEYGCRGFTVRDSRWPELIETLPLLEEEGEHETGPSKNNNILQKKRGRDRRAANILYHLLHRQLHVLLNYQQRHRGPQLRSNANSGSEKSPARVPLENVDSAIHRLQGQLKQQKVEIEAKDNVIKQKDKDIKEKDKEIIRLGRLLEQSANAAYSNEETASSKRTRLK